MPKLDLLAKLTPQRIRHSFRAKIFTGFLALGMLASFDTVFYIGRLLYRVELTEARSLMFATVVQMAETLDSEAVRVLDEADDPRTHPEYAVVRDQLVGMRDAIVCALDEDDDDPDASSADDIVTDLYILGRTDDPGTGRLIVTYNTEETGRLYDMSRFPVMMAAWDVAQAEEESATDEYGTTLSAYAPIRDGAGNTIAIVGLDTAGVYYRNVLILIVVIAFFMFLGGVLFSALFAWVLSRALSKPLLKLAGAIERVAGGDLNASVEEGASRDEFGLLSKRFNEMVRGLRDRASIKEDLGQAAAIQSGLLPNNPPDINGFDIAGGIRYSQETGGDYYDFIDIDSDNTQRLGIVVGDVTGHGVASALMMCSSRAIFRSAARESGEDVSRLMKQVNNSLVREFQMGKFITAFYGVLVPDEHRLEWTNAGHEHGLLVRANSGNVEFLKSTDIPVGIAPDRYFLAGRPITFEPGDTLIVGTDGISQARDYEGEFFGFDRVVDVVRGYKDANAEQVRDAILRAAQTHEGTDQLEDDATLVVVKCDPNTSPPGGPG
ncbi:MAG: hypothetical protein Phyf2KO_25100 [Phycisphaerales bacterium]